MSKSLIATQHQQHATSFDEVCSLDSGPLATPAHRDSWSGEYTMTYPEYRKTWCIELERHSKLLSDLPAPPPPRDLGSSVERSLDGLWQYLHDIPPDRASAAGPTQPLL